MLDTVENIRKEIEKLSGAVSLTVLELDLNRDVLIPAYLLANLMSPSLWKWRALRKVQSPDGSLLGIKRRLKELERQFHRYTFTYFPNEPGGDLWGLFHFSEEEGRLGRNYIQKIRREYDETLRKLLADNPESRFGQIVSEDYYKEGYFPRFRNETIEVMDAYALISMDRKGSGKCGALAILWAAALIIWGRFSPGKVVLIGNRAHVFVFLDEEDGQDSIFKSRKRIALPDETIIFKTGNDRDKALLLFTLLQHSQICDPEMTIGFSEDNSYVYYHRKWMESDTLSVLPVEPQGLRMVFNKEIFQKTEQV